MYILKIQNLVTYEILKLRWCFIENNSIPSYFHFYSITNLGGVLLKIIPYQVIFTFTVYPAGGCLDGLSAEALTVS